MCPACVTSIATWLFAGALGSGGAAAIVLRLRTDKHTNARNTARSTD